MTSAPCLYCKEVGEDTYVVDIVTHDEHESVIQPGERRIWWDDYKDHHYEEIDPGPFAGNALGDALARFVDQAEPRPAPKNDALPYAVARWAAKAFASHIRKGVDAKPYINHLIDVAALLAEAGVADP